MIVLVMFVGVANPRASSVLDFDAAADGAHSHCSAHLPSSMGSAGAVDVPAAVEAVDGPLLVLAGAGPNVASVFKMSGLDTVLTRTATVDEALLRLAEKQG